MSLLQVKLTECKDKIIEERKRLLALGETGAPAVKVGGFDSRFRPFVSYLYHVTVCVAVVTAAAGGLST